MAGLTSLLSRQEARLGGIVGQGEGENQSDNNFTDAENALLSQSAVLSQLKFHVRLLTSKPTENCKEQPPRVDHALVHPQAPVRDEPSRYTRTDACQPPKRGNNKLLVVGEVLIQDHHLRGQDPRLGYSQEEAQSGHPAVGRRQRVQADNDGLSGDFRITGVSFSSKVLVNVTVMVVR